MYSGSSLPRLHHAHHYHHEALEPIDTNAYDFTNHTELYESDNEYESVTAAILSPTSDDLSDKDSDDMEPASFNENNDTNTSINYSIDSQANAGPSQVSRINAIAKLKRAASQREMRGRGDTKQPPPKDGMISIVGAIGDKIEIGGVNSYLQAPMRSNGGTSVSPIPSPGMLRIEQLRSESASPKPGAHDGTSTPSSGEGSLLQRSRSQRGDARSPLPSLEQLRARILQERASAGLARSASTSAASAAARQYALEKLLGESSREGAISPVSDTAEDQEEAKANTANSSQFLSPAKNQDQRPLLRRSRTIGGLSAAAEAQRKAAFVQELDNGVPDDVKSGRRSSRRFAKAPLGGTGRSSTLGRPDDPSIKERNESQQIEQSAITTSKDETINDGAAATSLDRSQSQRQIARTEMMRKLSTRGRQGPKTSATPVQTPIPAPKLLANAADEHQEQLKEVPVSPERSLAVPFAQQSPVTPPPISLSSHLTPHYSPDNSMLTVPGSSPLRYSPSSRPSTGMTSYHEADRNRASEMARMNGEEAFEYEKLLEMGYSSDFAYERVASARSGSYVSNNVSPRSVQAETFTSQEIESAALREEPPSPSLKEEHASVVRSSSPSSSHPNQSAHSGGSPRLATVASIPLALGSRRQTMEGGDDFDLEKYELLEGDDIVPMSRRRAAWPESVTSVATSADPFSSPRKTVSTGRGSEDSKSSSKVEIVKAHPTLALSSANTIQRFDEILTPTFMRDFGDILDYSDSPIKPFFPSQDGIQSLQEKSVAATSAASDLDGSDYLLEVHEMRQKLGEMARRKNSTSRDQRDALVQQSSAAQVQAAASDEARRDTITSIGVDSAHTNIAPSISQDKVAISPTVSLLPLSGTLTPPLIEGSTSQSNGSHPYIANGKLSPFPGLLPSADPSPESSAVSLRMPSPLKPSKAGVDEGEDLTEEIKAPTFFTTLRRKASNAASRVQRGNEDSPGVQTTKRFGSLLRRKPSEARRVSKDRTVETPSPSEMPTPSISVQPREEDTEVKRDHIRVRRPILLKPASNDMLHRYSRMLTSTNDTSSQFDIPGLSKEHIEDPPRKLLLSCPILQVVTASAVKDRYLFIFTDLLIIAKPISPPFGLSSESLPTLQWTFSVKSVLEIAQMKQLTMPSDERRHPKKSVPLMEEFIQLFQQSPEQAIDLVISKSNLPRTAGTIAQILHQTPELDRFQLSKYLFQGRSTSQKEIAKVFVELDKSAGVSIESALRSFLLEIRFPPDRETFEDLLVTFAIKWTSNNKTLIKDTFSEQLTVDLVFAIMALNDALHTANYSTPRMFSQSMPDWSKEDFLEAFRYKDPDAVLSDRTVTRIYASISQEPLQQALLPTELGEKNPVCIHSPGIPTRLTFGTYSNAITVSIPRIDPDFAIRLYGQDLAFSPQILSFEKSRVQEFKVTSKSLGVKTIVFVRTGRNALFYPSSATQVDDDNDFTLPRSINIVIERAFNQHCFTLAMKGSELNKMTFSVENEMKRKECTDYLKGRMLALTSKENRMTDRATEALALHVLREAIQEESDTIVLPLQRSASAAAAPSTRGATRMRGLTRAPSDARALEHLVSGGAGINRNESVSKHYYQAQGKNERDLALTSREKAIPDRVSNEKTIRGDDLIMTVRQNSLLSIVVAHLQQQDQKRF